MALTVAELRAVFSADTRRFEQGNRRVQQQIGRTSGFARQAGATMVGFLGAQVVQSGLRALQNGFRFVGDSMIGFNDQLDRSDTAFTTMLGSGRRARKFLDDLKQFAVATPFEFTELVLNSQRLMAMGFAAKDVLPTLKAVGDATAGLGGDPGTMHQIIRALGQMQAKGKVMSGEMTQLAEAGVGAWDMLAKSMGVSVPKAMKMVEDGAVSSAKAVPAIVRGMNRQFGGLMDKQSKTFMGAMSNISDAAVQSLARVTRPAFEKVRDSAVRLAGWLSKGGLERKLAAIGDAFKSDRAQKAMDDLRRTVTGLQRAVDPILDVALPMLKGLFLGIAAAVSLVLLPAMAAATEFFGEHRTTTLLLAGAIGALVLVTKAHAVAMGVQAAGGLLKYLKATKLVTAATRVLTAVQWALNLALKSNPIGRVIQLLFLLGAALVVAWKTNATFRDNVKQVWAAVRKAITAAWDFYIKPALRAWWRFMTGSVIPVVKALWTAVKPVFEQTGLAVRVAWTAYISPALKAMWTFLNRDLIPVVLSLWRSVIRPVFQQAGAAVRGAWNGVIGPALRAMRDFITGALVPTFRRGFGAINSMWEGLKEAAKAPVRFLVNTIYNDGIRKMIGYLPGVATPKRVELGFERGGYTGRGGKKQPAGVVHADEFVVRSEARRAFERRHPGALDFLNATGHLPGFFLGGRVPLPGATSIVAHQPSEYPFATWAGDLNAPNDLGKPVVAWKDGFIAALRYLGDVSYGRYAVVNHGGQSTWYAHLNAFAPWKVGDPIRAGQTLGYVGNIGNSTGPHLHFELRGGDAALAMQAGLPVPEAEKKPGGFSLGAWRKAFGRIRKLVSSVRGWIGDLSEMGGGWAPLLVKSARGMGNDAIDWLNRRIPNKWLPDNPIPNLFDRGGWLLPGTPVNRTGRPEAVLTPEESAAFVKLAKQFAAGDVAPGVTQHVHASPTMDEQQLADVALGRLVGALQGLG